MPTDDLSRIQGGEGAKFNSSLSDLERIHNLLVLANQASISGRYTVWLGALHGLDREISTYLNDEEDKDLGKVRVLSVIADSRAQSTMRRRLDQYERRLRYYRSKKKLGIVADDDASTAMMR